jgi:hypothetical protein
MQQPLCRSKTILTRLKDVKPPIKPTTTDHPDRRSPAAICHSYHSPRHPPERLYQVTASRPSRVNIRIVQVFGRRHDEPFHALRRPASKKRQGTKSREVLRWRCCGRYGDLMAVPG